MENDQFDQLKRLISEKFETVLELAKDDYAIIIKEELVDAETGKRNFELGIGKTMVFPNRISINGKTYRTDELEEIKEGSVLVPARDLAKQDDRHRMLMARIPKALNRAVDEAAWGGSFKTLGDVLRVLSEFS